MPRAGRERSAELFSVFGGRLVDGAPGAAGDVVHGGHHLGLVEGAGGVEVEEGIDVPSRP